MITITIDHDAIATALAALRGLSAPFAERREVTCTACGEPCVDAAKAEALRDRDILLREVRESDAREQMARQEMDEALTALGPFRARNGIVAGVREAIEELGELSDRIDALTAERDEERSMRRDRDAIASVCESLRCELASKSAEAERLRADLAWRCVPDTSTALCTDKSDDAHRADLAAARKVLRDGIATETTPGTVPCAVSTDALPPMPVGLSGRAAMRALAARGWTGTRADLAAALGVDEETASRQIAPSTCRAAGIDRVALGDGVYRLAIADVPVPEPRVEAPSPVTRGRKPSPLRQRIQQLAEAGWSGTRDEFAAALGVSRNTAQERITPGRLRELGVQRHDCGVGRYSLRPLVVVQAAPNTSEDPRIALARQDCGDDAAGVYAAILAMPAEQLDGRTNTVLAAIRAMTCVPLDIVVYVPAALEALEECAYVRVTRSDDGAMMCVELPERRAAE